MNFYLLAVVKAAVVVGVLMITLLYLQWVERKVIAHIQVRLGPYNVGPHGLLQPIADTMKLMTKEDLLPPGVNRFYFILAPFLAITLSLLSIAVIPFGPQIHVGPVNTWLQLTDLNIGVIFVLAISSLTVYGIVLAGWSSNSKYPLLGALRSSAQMISYELPLGMAVAAALLLSNSLSLRKIVETQSAWYGGFFPAWNLFRMPFPQIFGFLIFLIAVFAETNRVPFDLPEAESELVAGFHTEYSSHEVRRILHGGIRQHDHGDVHGDGALSGRLAAALARVDGLELRARGRVRLGGRRLYLQRPAGAKARPSQSRCFGALFLLAAALFLIPVVQRCWLRCSGFWRRPVCCCSSSFGCGAPCRASATTS